jgi:hypothetical protein
MTISFKMPLAAALLLGSAAVAQQGDPVAREAVDAAYRMGMAVSAAVQERVKDLIDAEKNVQLVLVALQTAIAETCEGYEMDWDAFASVMNGVTADLQALTEEGQNNLAVDVVMHAYGIALGGEVAIAAFDTADYCERAEEFREQLETESDGSFTVWKARG